MPFFAAVFRLCWGKPLPSPLPWRDAALPTSGLPSGDSHLGFLAVKTQPQSRQLCMSSGISPWRGRIKIALSNLRQWMCCLFLSLVEYQGCTNMTVKIIMFFDESIRLKWCFQMKVVLIYPLYAARLILLPELFEASFYFMALAVATAVLYLWAI